MSEPKDIFIPTLDRELGSIHPINQVKFELIKLLTSFGNIVKSPFSFTAQPLGNFLLYIFIIKKSTKKNELNGVYDGSYVSSCGFGDGDVFFFHRQVR